MIKQLLERNISGVKSFKRLCDFYENVPMLFSVIFVGSSLTLPRQVCSLKMETFTKNSFIKSLKWYSHSEQPRANIIDILKLKKDPTFSMKSSFI